MLRALQPAGVALKCVLYLGVSPQTPKKLYTLYTSTRPISYTAYHGTHQNAPLCGTDRAEEKGFHTVQPQIAPFKISVHERWTHVSEMPEGLFHAAFGAPRMRVSVCSVVMILTKIVVNGGRASDSRGREMLIFDISRSRSVDFLGREML